jgi:DNA N-6-adenine-methyltransferase (Dam)
MSALVKYGTAPADQDAAKIGSLYREARAGMVASVRCIVEAGQRLAAKKFKLGHGRWLPWLEANANELGFSDPATAWRLMNAAAKAKSCAGARFDEAQALQISREIWGHNQPALYSSDSVEWYTPARYIEGVRELLGEIDLDPASCAEANKVVRAKRFFTREDNGLEQDWCGTMFLNPPYGTQNGDSVASMFCAKALAEYDLGNITEGIILVNSLHSQAWQAPLYSQPICFVDHRIKFVSGEGKENENPTMSNIFVYLGPDEEKFARVFSRFGFVMLPALRASP